MVRPITPSRALYLALQIRALRWFRFSSVLLLVVVVSNLAVSMAVNAAPKMDLNPFWDSSVESNQSQIEHSSWQDFLTAYVQNDSSKSVNLVAYSLVSDEDLLALNQYISALKSIDPRQYSRLEQKAYWINLYNALTVNLILKNYPVSSITKIHQRFFSFGPWDDEIISIMGQPLSLNDIEHRILRPIYRDPKIHYAVNCASISCPNLAPQAYTRFNLEGLLESGEKEYINHARGVTFEGEQLLVSSIYKWYQEDFGANEREVIEYFSQHAAAELKAKLTVYRSDIEYRYDWSLNETK